MHTGEKTFPSGYCRFKLKHFRGCVASHLPETLPELLQDYRQLRQHLQIIKDSRSTLAGILEFDGKSYFYKQHNVKSLFHRLRRAYQHPRPMRNQAITAILKQNGIVAPEVLLVGRHGYRFCPGADVLLTEVIPPPMSVHENFEALQSDLDKVIPQLGRLLAQMHCAGVWHGDLKLSNILCRRTDVGLWEFGLFDFDGSQYFPGGVPQAKRIRDLARLVSSWELRLHSNQMEQALIKAYTVASGNGLPNKVLSSQIQRLLKHDLNKRKAAGK